jgi:hypothetical protein
MDLIGCATTPRGLGLAERLCRLSPVPVCERELCGLGRAVPSEAEPCHVSPVCAP